MARRPNGIFTRPERTPRKRRPTFALVAVSRVGLPWVTLPALSLAVTRMSIFDALPRSMVARSLPLAKVDLRVRYGSVELRRTSTEVEATPETGSLKLSTIRFPRARWRVAVGGVPSICS